MTLTKKIIKKINAQQILNFAVFFLLFSLLIGNLITLSYGIENLRLMHVFSTGEPDRVKEVMVNLKYDDLDPRGFYNYGYFYQTIGFFLIKTLKYFGFKVDPMLVALVLRLISLVSYVLAGVIIYRIFTKYLNGKKEFGLILVLFLLSIPAFSHWSRLVQPDIFQVFLVLFAALVAFSKHTAARVIIACALAGAAFGTKYSGIFILPFLLLPYFLHLFITSPKKPKVWLKVIFVSILAVLIFLAVWIVTNPYVLKNFDQFQSDFSFEKKHVARGDGRAESKAPFLWFTVLWNLLGPMNTMVVAVGILIVLALLIITLKKDNVKKFFDNHFNRNRLTIILYIMASFAYLVLEVNMRRPRYLFHILPFILVIAILGFQKISTFFKRAWITPFIIIALFFSFSTLAMQSLKKASITTRKHDHPHIKAGEFLALNESDNLRVLANPYSYVPPKFKVVRYLFFIDEAAIKMYRPDIIILNAIAIRRWSWKKKGTSFRDLDFLKGSFDYSGHCYRSYKKLFSPTSPWKIIYETDTIVILKKTDRLIKPSGFLLKMNLLIP